MKTQLTLSLIALVSFANLGYASETKSACGQLGYWKINTAASDSRVRSKALTAFSLTDGLGRTATFNVSKEDMLMVLQVSAAARGSFCVKQAADGSVVSLSN